MPRSLIKQVMRVLPRRTIGKIAASLGVEPKLARFAVAAMVPQVLSGVASTAETADGASRLSDALVLQDPAILTMFTKTLGAADQDLFIGNGTKLASQLLGTAGRSGVIGAVSKSSGLGQAECEKLLGVLTPVIAATLAKQQLSKNLDAAGLANLLGSQKELFDQSASQAAALAPDPTANAPGGRGLLHRARRFWRQDRRTGMEDAPDVAEVTIVKKDAVAEGSKPHIPTQGMQTKAMVAAAVATLGSAAAAAKETAVPAVAKTESAALNNGPSAPLRPKIDVDDVASGNATAASVKDISFKDLARSSPKREGGFTDDAPAAQRPAPAAPTHRSIADAAAARAAKDDGATDEDEVIVPPAARRRGHYVARFGWIVPLLLVGSAGAWWVNGLSEQEPEAVVAEAKPVPSMTGKAPPIPETPRVAAVQPSAPKNEPAPAAPRIEVPAVKVPTDIEDTRVAAAAKAAADAEAQRIAAAKSVADAEARRAAEARSAEVKAAEIKSAEVRSAEIKAAEMKTAEMKAAVDADLARKAEAAKAAADADAARIAANKAAADAEVARKANAAKMAAAAAPPPPKPTATAEPPRQPSVAAGAPTAQPNASMNEAQLGCEVAITEASKANLIRFGFASADIRKSSLPVLDRLATVIKTCPATRIRIEGHTDTDGHRDRNVRLSANRAKSVTAYLSRSGVDPRRLSAVGYGQDRPLVPNTSDANKLLNRRIEFVMLPNG